MLEPIARCSPLRTVRATAGALVGLAVVVVALAGCGSGGSYGASSTSPTTAYASGPTTTALSGLVPHPTRPGELGSGSLYLSIIGATNQATVAFDTALAKL